ncbi:hypothetical protein CVT24_012927 [Panaeolus cyanescens]|uniref:Uncharacterized protein n=1 Tax=Panaeolus cyanescens TaxID=181874 RepID=A0A409WUN6_9AGAR|nr:hypothetical protein CVT24_012927 [Panaeolus cyanescens]
MPVTFNNILFYGKTPHPPRQPMHPRAVTINDDIWPTGDKPERHEWKICVMGSSKGGKSSIVDSLLRLPFGGEFHVFECGDWGLTHLNIRVVYAFLTFFVLLEIHHPTSETDVAVTGLPTNCVNVDHEESHATLFIREFGSFEAQGNPTASFVSSIKSRGVRNVKLIVLVFGLDSQESFLSARLLHLKLMERYQDKIIILVGNKSDLESQVCDKEAVAFAKKIGSLYVKTSAKTGANIHKLFNNVVKALAIKDHCIEATPRTTLCLPPMDTWWSRWFGLESGRNSDSMSDGRRNGGLDGRKNGGYDVRFATWAPTVYAYYESTTQRLAQKMPLLKWTFWRSVFLCATFNFGPNVTCVPHRDFLNLPFGWCAIIALGNYDYVLGGHLVLHDLRLVIEFPPPVPSFFKLFPLRFSPMETRPFKSGIFRYVENGFMCEGDLEKNDPAHYASMMEAKAGRKEFGLGLWSTLDELLCV